MRWQDSAKYDLTHYLSYKRSIENIDERIKMIDARMHAARTVDLKPTPANHGAGERQFDDTWVDCIVEKDNIKMGQEIERRKVELIERGLNGLSEEQRHVLTLFYIDRPRDYMDRICEDLHIEKTTAYKIKDAALRKFTLEEYGIDI